MLRHTLAALAVGTMMAGLPRAAEATVTYTLTDVAITVPNPGAQGPNPGYPFTFTVSDAAVARGSFQLSGSGSFSDPPMLSGDVADFINLSLVGDVATSTRFPGSVQWAIAFAPDRSISSFNFDTLIGDNAAILSGTRGSLISGSFGTGRQDCNSDVNSRRCLVTGRLVENTPTSVPEPMSLALLGMGLLGMMAVRRKHS